VTMAYRSAGWIGRRSTQRSTVESVSCVGVAPSGIVHVLTLSRGVFRVLMQIRSVHKTAADLDAALSSGFWRIGPALAKGDTSVERVGSRIR
jgi:hypothetical protein